MSVAYTGSDGTTAIIKTLSIDISSVPSNATLLVIGSAYTNVYASLSWSYSAPGTAYFKYSISGTTLTITGYLYDHSYEWYAGTSDSLWRGTSSNLTGSVYYITY